MGGGRDVGDAPLPQEYGFDQSLVSFEGLGPRLLRKDDHGFHLGELGIWTKHVNYEMANNIPLIIKAPGVTKVGSSTEQLAETVDTLAERAGLPRPNTTQPLDRESMAPVLKDPEARVSDYVYHTYPRGNRVARAIRTDRYRIWNGRRLVPILKLRILSSTITRKGP